MQRIPATPFCLDFEETSLTSCGCGHTGLVYSERQGSREKSTRRRRLVQLSGGKDGNFYIEKSAFLNEVDLSTF